MKRVAHLALTLSIASLTYAQTREPLFGRVVNADDKPLAGATVTLVEDDLDLVGIDPVDVLTVITDKRGRFAAQALRGVRYSAFALAPGDDGRALVSKPVSNLFCGGDAKLHAIVTGYARRVPLPDLGAWGELQNLRVRLRWSGCAGHHVDLPIDDGGGISVPASSVVAAAFLVDIEGHRLGRIWIPPDDKQGDAVIPEARTINVTVVDDAGKPVAGAVVKYVGDESHTTPWGLINNEYYQGFSATTDDRGCASLQVEMWSDPFQKKPDTYVFVAHKQGYGEGASGWLYHEAFANGRVIDKHAGQRLRITLPKSRPLERGRAPQPLCNRHVRLFATGTVTNNQNGLMMHYWLPRSYGMQIDQDGRWDIPTAVTNSSRFALRVPPIDGKPVLLQPGSSPNMISIDASELAPLSIQILDADEDPNEAKQLLIVPEGSGSLDFMHAVPLTPDKAGRVDVLLQRGTWLAVAMTDNSWASATIEQWPPEELKLRLSPKPSCPVRVLDADGKPVQGAKFEPGSFRAGQARRGVNLVLTELGWNALGMHVRRATTDANGEATLYFLPCPGTQPTVFAWLGSFQTASEHEALIASDERLELRLR